MTTQQVAECPKCGCDAMAETRSMKPDELPTLDELADPRLQINAPPRIFTCSNCGTRFERPSKKGKPAK